MIHKKYKKVYHKDTDYTTYRFNEYMIKSSKSLILMIAFLLTGLSYYGNRRSFNYISYVGAMNHGTPWPVGSGKGTIELNVYDSVKKRGLLSNAICRIYKFKYNKYTHTFSYITYKNRHNEQFMEYLRGNTFKIDPELVKAEIRGE